jgi:hypothetical protein
LDISKPESSYTNGHTTWTGPRTFVRIDDDGTEHTVQLCSAIPANSLDWPAFYAEVDRTALSQPDLLAELLPGGHFEGREYRCASINGDAGHSFAFNLDTGVWTDFNGSGKGGKGLISLYARVRGVEMKDAARTLGQRYGIAEPVWSQIIPVPAAEIEQILAGKTLPRWNHDWGNPKTAWLYKTAEGTNIGFIVRFEKAGQDGHVEKNTIPLSYGRWGDGRAQLRWKSFAEPRPLYNLERLADNLDAIVVVVEGEKCVGKLQQLFDEQNITGHIAVTWPGGCKAVDKADWTPLYERQVIVWPDNDGPGLTAAARIARKLESVQHPTITRSVRIVEPDKNWPEGYDVADLIAEGWDTARILDCVSRFKTKLVDDIEILAHKRFSAAQAKAAAAATDHRTLAWAEHQINVVYEPQIVGPSKDITKIFELPYIEAAAIFSIEDAARYERLKSLLKTRGISAASLKDWERRVREHEHKIKKERSEQEKTAAQQKAKDEKSAAPTWAPLESASTQPENGYQLFLDIRSAIRKFVSLEELQATVAALWVLFTWIFEEAAETNPFLRILAPEPKCGKSTLIKILRYLSRGGWLIASATRSSFIRKLQVSRFTMLLDEGDSFLAENEDMRNVLNAASDPDTANVSLSIKQGDNWVSVDINAFVPITVASIKKLKGMVTVEDRSIHLWLKRATKAERKNLTKARHRALRETADPIADRCARWAQDNADKLVGMRPTLNFEDGRDEDKWEPLIGIADYLNQQLGQSVRTIAARMIGANAEQQESLSIFLLADIKNLFDLKREQKPPGDQNADKYTSKSLCEDLIALEERPWGSLPAGKERKPINQNRLAFMLRDYQIVPHNIRIGDETPKGYERKDFEDTWLRYAADESLTDEPGNPEEPPKTDHTFSDNPSFDDLDRHVATTQRRVEESGVFQGATETFCGGSKNGSKPLGENACSGVADKNPKSTDEKKEEGTDDPEIDRLAREDGWNPDDEEE